MSNRKEGRDGDEDGGLVAACQKGDGDAFGLLVQKYQKRAFNIAYRMTGDYEEAADVVQEAFLSAYRSIRSFRGDAKFSTWLYRICVNHAKSRLGQVKGRALHEGPSLDDGERTGGPAGAGARADEPGADERLAQRELQEAVQRAIARLEEDHRVVLVLRDMEGFSYDEIGDILHLPAGTVKSRLFRARDALRQGLKGLIKDL